MGGEKRKTQGVESNQRDQPRVVGKRLKRSHRSGILSAGRSRFIQFCIDLLDQAAVGQGAMGLLLGNLKMPGQREQLIVHHPDTLRRARGKTSMLRLVSRGSVILDGAVRKEIEVKFQVIAHQRILPTNARNASSAASGSIPPLRSSGVMVSFATTSGRGSAPRTRAENSSAG